MVSCPLCGVELQDKGALAGHLWFKHKVKFKDYMKEHPEIVAKLSQPPQHPPIQTPPASNQTPPPPPPPPQLGELPKELSKELPSDWVDKIAKRTAEIIRGENGSEGLPEGAVRLPMEEVEIVGEKINYKVALNPEIFSRYNIFKARNAMLADQGRVEKWGGDFSDFVDLSTKTVLNVYGMYPTVLTVSGGKMLLELPSEVRGK